MCRVEAGASVLINLPGDACLLQALGISRPPIPLLRVVDYRAATISIVAHPPRPHVVAVRVRRPQKRAVVGVAHGEGIGERIVVGDIAPREVRHGGSAFVWHPLVVFAVVPGCMCTIPVVRQILQELQAQVRCAGMERQDVAIGVAGVRLVPHALARGQLDRPWVAEPAHSAKCPEVVIEGAVLLHHENDVLDVVDCAGAVIGRYCQRSANACRKRGRGCSGSQKL